MISIALTAGLSVPVCALSKEMPQSLQSSKAKSSASLKAPAKNSSFKAQPAESSKPMVLNQPSLPVPVAYRQPNRIYVEGGKIVRAVADASLLQLNPDEATGALYVIPMTRENTGLFVVTESGETISLTLSPKDRISSQTVALQARAAGALSAALPAGSASALPYEEKVQMILRKIPALNPDHAEGLQSALTDGVLKASGVRFWRTEGVRLEHYRLFNPAAIPHSVEEKAFYADGVLAVASDRAELGAHDSSDLWIIRRERP